MSRPFIVRVYEQGDGPLIDDLRLWIAVSNTPESAVKTVEKTMTVDERDAIWEIGAFRGVDVPDWVLDELPAARIGNAWRWTGDRDMLLRHIRSRAAELPPVA